MSYSPHIPSGLLSRMRACDERAWADIVHILRPFVSQIITSQVRRTADHEDLSQEVFYKVFSKLNQFGGHAPFIHWVARLTRNACHDWQRRIKCRPLISYSDLPDTMSQIIENRVSSQPEKYTGTSASTHDLFYQLINTLKPTEQIVIRLFHLEEKSVQEISSLTGYEISKIKVTAMRARRKLSEQAKDFCWSDEMSAERVY